MKLNNKGFSLIEILAVVVIVAVVSTIGIVSVRRLIDNSKRHFYDTQEKQIVLAAQAYANDNKNILPKDIGGITRIKLQDLIDNNYIKEDIVDEQGNLCYTEPKTITNKKGESVDIDGTYVDVLKVNKIEYKYNGVLQCEKCLEKTGYKGATCETSKTKLNPDIDIYVPQIDENNNGNTIFNTKDAIKITIDAVQKSGSYDESILIVSYSYKIYVNNELRMNSGTKLNNKKNQIIIDDEKIFKYVPGVVKVVVTATNSEGKTITKSKSSDLKDATSPLCGRVTYDNNNKMKNYNYVQPSDIECGTKNYPWINIETDPGDRHVWIQCNDQEGIGCQQQEYSLYLSEDGEDQNVVIKDTNNFSNNCPVKKCIDKTTPSIKFNIRSSESKKANKTYTIEGQNKELSFEKEDKYNTWLNKDNYPNGVFLDVDIEDPTSKIKSFSWTESESYIKPKQNVSANKTVLKNSNVNQKTFTAKHQIKQDGYILQRIRVEDKAGNVVIYKITLRIDRTNPSCKTEDFSNECKTSGVSFKIYCQDDTSGVKKCGGDSKKGDQSTYTQINGLTNTKTYSVIDEADNTKTCKVTIYSDNQWRKATCNTCKNCDKAGCKEYNYITTKSHYTSHASSGCSSGGKTCGLKNCGMEYNANTSSICCCKTTTKQGSCKVYYQSCPLCGCSDYSWSNWSYNKLDCNGTTKNTCKTETRQLYRHQTKSCKEGIEPSSTTTKYTLTYNDNGGTGCSGNSITREKNQEWGVLCVPNKQGFTFVGWKDSNGNTITETTKATKNINAIAQWSEKALPTINIKNPSGGNWTKTPFSLTLSTNLSDDEVGYWYYTYADIEPNQNNVGSDHNTTWVRYNSSHSTKSYETTKFTFDRHQTVYIMLCSIYGQCVKASSTIKLDTTPPTLWGNVIHTTGSTGCLDGYTYCTLYYTKAGGSLGFEMFASDGDGSGLGAWGAIADYERGAEGCQWGSEYNYTWQGSAICSKNGTGNIKRCYKIKDRVGNVSSRYCTCYDSRRKTVEKTSNPDSCW